MSASVPVAPAILKLKRGEDRRLRAGHLWIFSNEVDTAATPLAGFKPGELVRVCTDRDQPLGLAYVNPNTLICARLLVRGDAEVLREGFIVERLRDALQLRERYVGGAHYRWVFGESDGLPGLILDRYGDVVVGQIATVGMQAMREVIERAVKAVINPGSLVWKNDSGARDLEGLPESIDAAWGPVPEEVQVVETLADGKALQFVAPLREGQKTGWFFDQTANRSRLAQWIRPGARVLDVCSYAGAWAATAASRGAASVTCVDSSKAALAYAARNVAANSSQTAFEGFKGDAFDVMAELATGGQRFDVVVIDPPAFIKRKRDLPQGQAAYRKLNQLALRLIEPNGLLVSCSCSYHLAPEELLSAIQTAARHVDRLAQVIHSGGQSPDHPVHPAIAETRYLKAFFCRVTHA